MKTLDVCGGWAQYNTVGGIPYNATVDEISQHMAQVGPVLSFRLKTDAATGNSKGYGFCTYPDAATAQLAIRQRLFTHTINTSSNSSNNSKSKSKNSERQDVQWACAAGEHGHRGTRC